MVQKPGALILNLAKSPVDPTLLLRAFTVSSWKSIVACIFLIIFWLAALHLLSKKEYNIGNPCRTLIHFLLTCDIVFRVDNENNGDFMLGFLCCLERFLWRRFDNVFFNQSGNAIPYSQGRITVISPMETANHWRWRGDTFGNYILISSFKSLNTLLIYRQKPRKTLFLSSKFSIWKIIQKITWLDRWRKQSKGWPFLEIFSGPLS